MKMTLVAVKIILIIVIAVSIGSVLGAIGYVASIKNNLPVAVQPTPTITQILTPIATSTPTATSNVDTSDWKTYRNEKYGYEIRYPDLYILDEKGNTAAYDSEKVRLVNFNINYSEITHNSVPANNTDYMNPSAIMKGYDPDKVSVIIDGINTFLYISKKSIKREYDCEFEAPCVDSVFPIELRVKKNTDMFTFSGFFKVDYLDKSIELYKKIFSSFRFLERDENGKIIVYVKKDNYEFQYSDNYFSEPPKITVVNSNISEFPDKCPDIDGGGSQDREGNPFMIKGEKKIIGDMIYCRYNKTTYSLGACTNIDINYSTIKNNNLYSINFLGGACCGGVGKETKYEECVGSNKKIPATIEKVIATFKFTEK